MVNCLLVCSFSCSHQDYLFCSDEFSSDEDKCLVVFTGEMYGCYVVVRYCAVRAMIQVSTLVILCDKLFQFNAYY